MRTNRRISTISNRIYLCKVVYTSSGDELPKLIFRRAEEMILAEC